MSKTWSKWNKALFCGLLIGALGPTVHAQTGCSIDSRNQHNVALPMIGDGVMSEALAADIRRGFDLASVQYDSSLGEQVLRKAQMQAEAEHNKCAEALALFGQGQAARTTQLDQALPLFRRAQVLLLEVGTPLAHAQVHERILTTQHLLGDDAPLKSEGPAVIEELHDAGDEAAVIMEKSMALQYSGGAPKQDEQKQLLEQLKTVQSANVVAVRGFVEWEVGSAMRRTGRFGEILPYFKAALADFAACDCEPGTRVAVLLNFAAAADAGSDAAAVLDYAQQADAIVRKYHFETLRPQVLRLLAAGYAHQGDFARAIETNETALRIARERKILVSVPTIGIELADDYGRAGDPLKGLAMLRETSPEHPTAAQVCELQSERMTLESHAKQYAEGEADGQKIFAGCKEIIQPSVLSTLNAEYAEMEMKQDRWEASLPYARESVRIIDTQRLRAEPTDRALRAFNEQKMPAYDALVEALVHLDKPEEALLASEQFRARAFVDLAGSRGAGGPQGAGPRGAANLPSEVHAFALTADDIRGVLEKQHSTLVSYWLNKDGRLTTWVVTPGKPVFQSQQAVDPVQLAALVKATLPGEAVGARRGAQVATRGGADQNLALTSRKPWRDLYNVLIAPIAAQLPQEPGSLLTVVPQGELFRLSFPALIDPQGRYLVERYALHTVPSAGVLQVTAKNDRAAAALPASYVLLANPASYPQVDGRTLPPLPGTAGEVRGISQRLGDKSVTLLEGRQAGIETLTQSLPKATVLHFATHAVVSDDAPLTSFLALDRGQRGGLLTAAAVYGLHMNASLVVLSACSTGRGQVSGDGVAGLSRAFFYAGAASLVTTLWDVVDEPTAQLMPRFYSGLAKGETRSTALRKAQLGLIDDLRKHRVKVKTLTGTEISLPERPTYWAAFSLSGQP